MQCEVVLSGYKFAKSSHVAFNFGFQNFHVMGPYTNESKLNFGEYPHLKQNLHSET
jgi:hypothetical protein